MKRLLFVLLFLGCAISAQAQGITLSQSLSTTVLLGPFTVDGITPLTGYGPVAPGIIYVSKNGGSFAAKNDSSTCVADASLPDYCKTTLSTTDTNTIGELVIVVNSTSATTIKVEKHYIVAASNSYALNYKGQNIVAATDIVSNGPITTSSGAVSNVTNVSLVTTTTTVTSLGVAAIGTPSFAGGAITSGVLSNNAITSSIIATDAIGAAQIAANAIGVSEAPNLDAAVSSRLAPTVAARTLDVSAGGGAGLDWANVKSPGTAVTLTLTTIGGTVSVDSLSTKALGQFFNVNTGQTYAGSATNSVVKQIVDNSGGAGFTVAQIVASTWGYAIATCSGSAGTTCQKLFNAGSATDPLTNTVATYSAGQLGHVLGQLPDTTAGASGGVFIAGSNAATTVNLTGNLSGSVGSVTGNVGGNVNGSTANVLAIAAGAVNATSAPNLDAAVSSRGSYVVKKNTAFNWPITFVSSTDHVSVPSSPLGVTCQRSIDAVNAFAPGSLTASTTTTGTFGGLSQVHFAASDVNGTNYVYLWCTATGADDVKEKFYIEQ